MNPRCARERDDDTRGPQHREPPPDTQATVHGLLGQGLPARNGNSDDQVGGGILRLCDPGEIIGDDPAGGRIDGGFSYGKGQARQGNGADAVAGLKGHACAGRTMADLGNDLCAVSDIRVITGVLDHRSRRHAVGQPGCFQAEGWGLAAR